MAVSTPTVPHSPNNSASRSPSPTPSESLINLPPSSTDIGGSTYLSGSVPNVLADRLLNLHSRSTASSLSLSDATRPALSRGTSASANERGSLFDLLRDGKKAKLVRLPVEGEEEEEEEEEEGEDYWQHRRESRKRDKSIKRREEKARNWRQRASPLWFLPGTLFMSLSIGMTIAPKLEIYNQLLCRAIGPERSGTTTPAPGSAFFLPLPRSSPENPVAASNVKWFVRPKEEDMRREVGEYVMGVVEKGTEAFEFEGAFDDGATKEGEGEEESWSKQCHKSREVQKAVASLNMTLTLIMGLLSALTTGYWGSLSDRRGRKPVLSLALLGTILMDAVFLITVNYHHIVGYRFLLLGPLLDGLFGGYSTAQATTNAYLSDCTDSGSRARIFSVLGGIMFAGIAIGPALGGLLIRATGSILTPFYIGVVLHSVYFLLAVGVFPESLSKGRQYAARRRHADEKLVRRMEEIEEDRKAKERGWWIVCWVVGKRMIGNGLYFLKPIGLLLPKKRSLEEKEEDRPSIDALGRPKLGWDFELIKIAGGLTFYSMVLAVMSVKLVYTGSTFGWGIKENSLYLSYVGLCRVIVLIVILPFVIKRFKRPAPIPAIPRPEGGENDEPIGTPTILDGTGEVVTTLTKEQKEWEKEAKWLRVVHDSHFDLLLSRLSILIDLLGYTLFALSHSSIPLFLFASLFSSFGGGASPAIQSLALAHASPRDSGRLFASLSVVSSLASQVVGPVVFGKVFVWSVEKGFEEGIFWVAVICFGVSLVAMGLIRVRKGEGIGLSGPEGESGSVGVREEEVVGTRRGRSETRKGRGGGGGAEGESGFSLRSET